MVVRMMIFCFMKKMMTRNEFFADAMACVGVLGDVLPTGWRLFRFYPWLLALFGGGAPFVVLP